MNYTEPALQEVYCGRCMCAFDRDEDERAITPPCHTPASLVA
jgi:hypothetical protein